MSRRRSVLAALVVMVSAACGPTTPTSPAPAASSAVVEASPAASVAVVSSPSAPSSVAPTTRPTVRPTPVPVPTATPLPTPVPTPVPWQSYKSKRFHYKMKYPPEWIVTPGTSKLPDSYDGFGPPWVYVERDTVSGVASVNLTMTRDIAYYKSHYKAKVLSNKPITLDGWRGRIITFKGKQDGRDLLFQHIIIAKGRVGYFLDMEGDFDQADADKALFKQIYKTFRTT